jgi:CheY-like chemotaxis protein
MLRSMPKPVSKWVLVVDDDEDTRELVVELLQGGGYLAVAAPGGTAALRMMGESTPAMVLTDLSMSGMDGQELLTQTRALLGTATPPFVFATGAHPSRLTELAEPVLSKPYEVAELLDVVGRHCRI